MKRFSERIKHKQTTASLEKLKNFATKELKKGGLGNPISKTARIDSKYDSFLYDQQQSNKIDATFDFKGREATLHPDNKQQPVTT